MTQAQKLLDLIIQYSNLDVEETAQRSIPVLDGYPHSELNVIQCIGATEHPNVSSIADQMNMTKGAISKIIRKLTDKGAITSYQLPGNRQKIFYQLTKQGEALFDAHARRHRAWEKSELAYLNTLPADVVAAAAVFFQNYNAHIKSNMTK